MKLPIQMRSFIEQTLKKGYPDKKFLFKTVLINGLRDELGQEVCGVMKPRFVHLYSENESQLNEAVFICQKILGDSFSFEISDGVELPDESTEIDINLHERSRTLNADDFKKVFYNSTIEESLQLLLKSTILLTINTYTLKGQPNAYTCDLTIRPTIASITPKDQNRLAFTSPYVAVEDTLNNDEYETLVDKYFDSILMFHDDKSTEFAATDTKIELLNIVKKLVLGESYRDSFTEVI